MNLENNKFYIQYNESKTFIQKLYKTSETQFNDGTKRINLYYKSESGGWVPSFRNIEKEPLNDLLEVTEDRMKELLKQQ